MKKKAGAKLPKGAVIDDTDRGNINLDDEFEQMYQEARKKSGLGQPLPKRANETQGNN